MLATSQTIGGSAEECRSDQAGNKGAVHGFLQPCHQLHERGAGGQLDAHGVVSILQLAIVSLSGCFDKGLLLVMDVGVWTADLATALGTEQRLLEEEFDIVSEHFLLEASQQGTC